MSSSLDIKYEMRAFDQKDRDYYDNFTEEDRKKFSTYLMLRWGSCVSGSPELQEWYLRVMNDRVNKNFFDLGKHPKLQWLMCTSVSPGMGPQHHHWLGAKKGEGTKQIKFLEKIYPHYNDEEIKILAQINTDEDLRNYARESGMVEKEVKKLFK